MYVSTHVYVMLTDGSELPNIPGSSYKSSMHSYYSTVSLVPFQNICKAQLTSGAVLQNLSNHHLLPRFRSCLCMSKSILGLPGTIPPSLVCLSFFLGIFSFSRKILFC